ncbi:MAG: Phosphoribosylformylglycinamidine synthase 2 [bacterium ADurb.Bin429]|nr:MAG: Phosphoribosylformylglycinamidine synthase 2 [bacterium ADurb.Bin429]
MAEAARNLVCVGADPAAVTDCLNFGNPEKPDRFWQLKRAVEGIAAACTALKVPVVSGNVSLYNEGPEAAVFPTPTIGMVGVLQHIDQHCTMGFKKSGHQVALVGVTRPELGGSEYLAVQHGLEAGMPPALDLPAEVAVQNFVLEAIRRGLVASAHDCSEGGLAVTLAESAIAGEVGVSAAVSRVGDRVDMTLFAESQSRIVISFDPRHADALAAMADELGADFQLIGSVGGSRVTMLEVVEEVMDLPLDAVKQAHHTPIYAAMGEA